MKNESSQSRSRGRPRSFDRDAALWIATQLFWKHGYEGTSIADLTEAMGITPQSLYAAYRSKADLYRESVQCYLERAGSFTSRALDEEKDVLDAFARVFSETAERFSTANLPQGCMVSTAVLTCAQENQPVADHVRGLRSNTLTCFQQRIEQAIEDRQLPLDTEARSLARYLGALIQGMSIQAQDGAARDELAGLARIGIEELRRRRNCVTPNDPQPKRHNPLQ